MEHKDALETPVIDALCNVDALHDVLAVPIDDLPGVAHELVVGIDAVGGRSEPAGWSTFRPAS